MANDQPEVDQLGIELVERWRAGDEEAVNLLYLRYVKRMMKIVWGQLGRTSNINARFDPEDIVQSALWSVFRRLQNGEYFFRDDADLWKLLATVVLNKTRSQVGKNLAERRSVNREKRSDELLVDESILQRVSMQPCISDVLAFRESMEQVLAALNGDEAELLQMRLEGYSQQEIAEKLNITPRTVRRKLKGIREVVVKVLAVENADDREE